MPGGQMNGGIARLKSTLSLRSRLQKAGIQRLSPGRDVTGLIRSRLSENFNLDTKETGHAKEVIHAGASDR